MSWVRASLEKPHSIPNTSVIDATCKSTRKRVVIFVHIVQGTHEILQTWVYSLSSNLPGSAVRHKRCALL
jgi:hypothetical protein